MKAILCAILILIFSNVSEMNAQNKRARDYGITVGVLKPGVHNAITDVVGVTVGHVTRIVNTDIRTGVTAILPHDGNIYQEKVPAAIYIGNGFGKLAGYSQVNELGNIETPIVLTNTLSVPAAANALIEYSLNLPGNEKVRSVNAVVGETNDGYLNDIRGRHITENDVLQSIANARSGAVEEGNVGAGTGTVCFGYKGGIGTSSRVMPEEAGSYTLGVLVQSNFGGVLEINGVPVAKELNSYPENFKYNKDGSCMIIVATDAPLDSRNLERLAKRAFMALARTGGVASNGSGDYVIAFSTAEENRISQDSESLIKNSSVLRNEAMTPLFLAAIEATEEAVYNSLFAAESMTGRDGNQVDALPVITVIELLKKYNKINEE